jgi:hypothetical protein
MDPAPDIILDKYIIRIEPFSPYLYFPDVQLSRTQPASPALMGWFDYESVFSGDGSAKVALQTPSNYVPHTYGETTGPWQAYRATYVSGEWLPWQYWGSINDGASWANFWTRKRPITAIELDVRYIFTAGILGEVVLPAPSVGIFARKSELADVANDYTLNTTATYVQPSGTTSGTERGQLGEIFEHIYVMLPDGYGPETDPDALLAMPSTIKGIDLVVNLVPSLQSTSVSERGYTTYDAIKFSNSSVESLVVPAQLETKLDEVYSSLLPNFDVAGTITMPGYSLSVGQRPGLGPQIGKRTYFGQELTVTLWSTAFFGNQGTSVTFRRPDERPPSEYPRPGRQITTNPVATFNFINYYSDPENQVLEADFGNTEGNRAGTYFTYMILNDDYTYVVPWQLNNDYPDSLDLPSEIGPFLETLDPIPSGVQLITYPQYINYGMLETDVQFLTFAVTSTNFRSDGYWYDFGDYATSRPSIAGSPSSFTISMVPQQDRVQPMEFTDPEFLLSTTSGQNTFCLNQLTALGFTTQDLTP